MAETKLIAPNGAKVTTDSSRVDELIRRGFKKAGGSSDADKAPAKKAAAKKSSK